MGNLRVMPRGLILLFLLIAAFGCGHDDESGWEQDLQNPNPENPFGVRLNMQQGGVDTILINVAGGPVTVTAMLIGLNPDNVFFYEWSYSDARIVDIDGDPTDGQMVFEPSALNSGVYKVRLVVTDSDATTYTESLHFLVAVFLPVD